MDTLPSCEIDLIHPEHVRLAQAEMSDSGTAGIQDPYFGLLKITPWRVELGNLNGEALVCRKSEI